MQKTSIIQNISFVIAIMAIWYCRHNPCKQTWDEMPQHKCEKKYILIKKKSLDWFCVTVEVAFGYRINNGSFNLKYIQMPFFVLKKCDKASWKRSNSEKKKFKGYSTNSSTYMIFRRKYSWGNFHKFCTWQYKNHLPTLGYTNILGKSSLFSLVNTISCEW